MKRILGLILISVALIISAVFNFNWVNMPVINTWSVIGFLLWGAGTIAIILSVFDK